MLIARFLRSKATAYANANLFHTSTRAYQRSETSFGEFPALQPRRVVVSGLGLVTPLGLDVKSSWNRLLKGDCAIRKLSENDLPEEQRGAFQSLTCKIAACVDQKELVTLCQYSKMRQAMNNPKFIQFALLAAQEAMQNAGLAEGHSLAEESLLERRGVAIGSGMSATAELARAGQIVGAGNSRKLSPLLVPRVLANMAAGLVSMEFNFCGPNHSVSTACTTGAHAIGDAFNFIRYGQADVMIAGGTESCIDAVSLGGFGRMRALATDRNDDPQGASRPFDVSRSGFVMGEGAGIMVLEELEHARSRGAPIIAEVRGYGMSGDAHHIAQPPSDGRGAALAMQRALASGGVEAEDVCYLNAHATSTPQGDAAEATALLNTFPASPGHLKVSSTKGATGHLLGAAGAVEAIFSVLALHNRLAPPSLNLERESPDLLKDRLIGPKAQELDCGPGRRCAVMSNSFGFGGTNASLLFTQPPS